MSLIPRILLVSDAALHYNGGGISQTLANIFFALPKENLLIVSAEEDDRSRRSTDKNTIYFKRKLFPFFKNRIGKYVNKYIQQFTHLMLDALPIPETSKIQKFNPDIIIICAQGVEGIIVGNKIIKKFNRPFCIYLMDDWFAKQGATWGKKKLHIEINNLLSKASGWMMISIYLAEILSRRFAISDKPTLILHNPVELYPHIAKLESGESTIDIAYAGALWGMHFDAFFTIAKALELLRIRGYQVCITLYSGNVFWEMHKTKLEQLPVKYGGLIAYSQLYQVLEKHRYMLVCSSFLEEHHYFSRSSVQTKITDYMNVGRSIISIGPDYGACNQFITKNAIGFTIASTNEGEVANTLQNILLQTEAENSQIDNARNLIKSKYNKQQVIEKLLQFIYPLLEVKQ